MDMQTITILNWQFKKENNPSKNVFQMWMWAKDRQERKRGLKVV